MALALIKPQKGPIFAKKLRIVLVLLMLPQWS